MTIFKLLRTPLIGETPFAMTSFLQIAAYSNNSRAEIGQVVACSVGWIGRVCAVTHLVMNNEWTGDNDF